MPRVKLSVRNEYVFSYHTTLRIRDINYGNHLSNDAVVSLMHEARIAFFEAIGCTELDLGDGRSGIVVADLVVNYKNQGYLGDRVVIHLDLDELGKRSFRLFYKMVRSQDIIFFAETGIAVYDYRDEKTASLPEEFLKALDLFRRQHCNRPGLVQPG